MIISGFQGIGKSTLAGKDKYIDLESSNFGVSTPDGGISRPDNWITLYANTAIHLSEQGYNVFVSSHRALRDVLRDRKDFVCVVPDPALKDQWIQRLETRCEEQGGDKNGRALQRARDFFTEDIQDIIDNENYIIILDTMDYDLACCLEIAANDVIKYPNLGLRVRSLYTTYVDKDYLNEIG